MFGSPPIDSHRLRNRGPRGSPLATHYRTSSTHVETIIALHVSSAQVPQKITVRFNRGRSKGFRENTRVLLFRSYDVGLGPPLLLGRAVMHLGRYRW